MVHYAPFLTFSDTKEYLLYFKMSIILDEMFGRVKYASNGDIEFSRKSTERIFCLPCGFN